MNELARLRDERRRLWTEASNLLCSADRRGQFTRQEARRFDELKAAITGLDYYIARIAQPQVILTRPVAPLRVVMKPE